MLLVMKMTLVPLMLCLVTLAGRRWGAAIAGWLAGFPIVAGPILMFIALDHGNAFASVAATASLSAVFASVTFNLCYAWACRRHSWAFSLLAGLAGWICAALLLGQLPGTTGISLIVALLALLVAPRLFPRMAGADRQAGKQSDDLFARAVAGAMLSVMVTRFSATVGPGWSGLLTVFPILGIVLAVGSHRKNGARFAADLLRAMASGLYSFMAFCATLALLLRDQALAPSFIAATIAAIVAQAVAKKFVNKAAK